ncbi:hypothetical protein E3N88_30236 [Mikania micrantha]|uniref:Uncharacterized protein n=1 Tax=Mikania micrantha TaxID=192012 RepID=A0A5N6MLH6_9ASTR|nr:hypothetical protein E3N88_30236 [Mikania micrantha]
MRWWRWWRCGDNGGIRDQLRVSDVLKRFLIINSSSSGFSESSTKPEDEDDLWYEVTDSFSSSDTTSGILFLCYENSCLNPKVAFCDFRFESIFDQETTSVCSSSNLDDEITSFSVASSSISSYSFPSRRDLKAISSTRSSTCTTLLEDQEDANDDGVDHYGLTDFRASLRNKRVSPTVTSVDSVSDCDTLLFSSASLPVVKPDEEEKDSFYKLYTERMKWFDLLHQERTYELNAFLTKKEHMGGEKRIIKSLENDFEMVYVAQSCLSWEALHNQYRKLDSIIISYADTICTSSPYGGALCSSSLVNKFQRFQILLERFMEDERSEKGKRYSNFIQKRSSLNSLLQVPYISENMNVYKDGRNKGLTIRATDLLKTIEKCMKTFKSFIELDEKRPWWRAHSRFSWNRSPLEDPRDFNLLRKLTHTLQQVISVKLITVDERFVWEAEMLAEKKKSQNNGRCSEERDDVRHDRLEARVKSAHDVPNFDFPTPLVPTEA